MVVEPQLGGMLSLAGSDCASNVRTHAGDGFTTNEPRARTVCCVTAKTAHANSITGNTRRSWNESKLQARKPVISCVEVICFAGLQCLVVRSKTSRQEFTTRARKTTRRE